MSLRGAKRRGNLAVPGRIVGKLSAKTQLPSRDCHVGLWPPRNDKLGSLTHSPEISPDLQLPKAVTDRRYRRNWCIPFSRWPVQIGSASPRLPRARSALAMTNLEALTAHIASLHGGHCPMDKSDIPGFARSKTVKKLPSRKFRREEKCERKPSGFPFAFNHPPQRQNCKIIIQ